jgi:hypothetical protein
MDKPTDTKTQVRFDGFNVSTTAGEVTMHLMLDGKIVATLQSSQKVAKTLGEVIGQSLPQEFPPGSLLHLYTPERDAEELILAKGSSLRVEDE